MGSTSKKALRMQIQATLMTTFSDLKSGISEKKFNRNIKKASKRLIAGLKETAPAKEVTAAAVL